MSSVNKESLREEFDTLKARFERLCAEEKMGSESRALFQAMLMLFELLMAVFMERRTTKDSNNSSKPSSQTHGDDTAVGRPGAKGKGKAQNNARSSNTRTVETVQVAQVHVCETCGEDLDNTPCDGHERRTKIDIVFEKVVSHVDAEIKQCPRCQERTKGRFPADMPGPLQYGPGVKAYALNLLITQMVSLKRVQQLIITLIGQAISEATLLKYSAAMGRVCDRTALGHACHARGRDFLPCRQKQLLDPCLFRGRNHVQVPPSQPGPRGHGRHRRDPALRRSGDP